MTKLNDIMKFEKEELIKKNENVIKEKEENIKLRVNNLKLENEVLKNNIENYKSLNLSLKSEIDLLKQKVKYFNQDNTENQNDDELQYYIKQYSNLKEENTKVNDLLDTTQKQKENYEKISQDYIKKFEELEQKFDSLTFQHNELIDKSKKLELMVRSDRNFGSPNPGIALDRIMMSENSGQDMFENLNADDQNFNQFAGYMKVNLKPTKITTANKKPIQMNLNMNKDYMIPDINVISSDILQKKEQYLKDPNQFTSLLEFGTGYYSSTISENNDLSNSKNNSLNYSNADLEHNDLNESAYSTKKVLHKSNSNANEINMVENYQLVEPDDENYNSFKFESKVADYSKKNILIRSEEFGTQTSNATGKGGYIPPKNTKNVSATKKILAEYERDDELSEKDYENDDFKFHKHFISNDDSLSDYTYSDYYKSQNKESKNNKVVLNKQNTIDYNSGYESNPDYFMNRVDPK